MNTGSKPSVKRLEKKSHGQKIRLVVQIFFFALVAVITAAKALDESGIVVPLVSGVSLHSICPFGGVVSLYQYVTEGSFIQRIHESSFVMMIIIMLMAVLVGPAFCGWVCPLGSIQEWVGRLGHKLMGKRYNHIIPAKADRVLRYLRYGVLGLVVYITARSAQLVFQSVDPFYALFHFYTGEAAVGALIVLGITLALSLIMERPWCKYACPYGALLGLTNLFRIFKIRRNDASCTSCTLCDKTCPMNIDVSKTTAVLDHQCITCMKCTSECACPASQSVVLAAGKLKKADCKKGEA